MLKKSNMKCKTCSEKLVYKCQVEDNDNIKEMYFCKNCNSYKFVSKKCRLLKRCLA